MFRVPMSGQLPIISAAASGPLAQRLRVDVCAFTSVAVPQRMRQSAWRPSPGGANSAAPPPEDRWPGPLFVGGSHCWHSSGLNCAQALLVGFDRCFQPHVRKWPSGQSVTRAASARVTAAGSRSCGDCPAPRAWRVGPVRPQ